MIHYSLKDCELKREEITPCLSLHDCLYANVGEYIKIKDTIYKIVSHGHIYFEYEGYLYEPIIKDNEIVGVEET